MTLPTSPPTAERVGRYQLLEPIGAGPCGTVSRAKVFGVAGFERQFAIKRFHTEITSVSTMAQSLSAAARGYGSLEHPRIARMSEFGIAQGTTFTAVEFVAGLDALRLITEARLAGVALAAGGALALVSQAARAVGYAHGRGLTHLGLSPTNVIVTSEGDIKITDFGILAATLPQRPIDALRLAQRVQYLAPEQLAGEATSAATDVFALGVLAFELVTGQRAFPGDTAQDVAKAVLAGPPPEPSLPRPIVRVLQRCVARSPFERFPDARALADALDAALRVAPVPGTRKDIGAQVKASMDRLAAMNEGEQSGMMSLDNVANTPARKEPISAIPVLGNKVTTREMSAADSPGDLGRAGEIVKPMNTVAGLAPPPSAVPPGVTPPPPIPGARPPAIPAISAKKPTPPGSKPLRDAATIIPTITPRPAAATPPARPTPVPPTRPTPTPPSEKPRRPPMINVDTKPGVEPPIKIPEGKTLPDASATELEIQVEKPKAPKAIATDPGIGISPASPAMERQQRPTDEMSPILAEQLQIATTKPTRDLQAIVEPPPSDDLDMSFAETAMVSDEQALELDKTAMVSDEQALELDKTAMVSDEQALELDKTAMVTDDHAVDLDKSIEPELHRTVLGTAPPARTPVTKPGLEPARPSTPKPAPLATNGFAATPPPIAPQPQPQPQPPPSAPYVPQRATASVGSPADQAAPTAYVPSQRGSRKGLWIALSILGLAALGTGAFFAYNEFLAPKAESTASAPVATDAGATQVAATTDGGGNAPPPVDAAVAAIADASQAPADAPQVAAAIDAGAPTPIPTPGGGDTLTITSTPPGARVFIDGADSGVTPLKLPGTADKHSVALFLPSHELYVAQVDGRGTFAINLKTVTPLDGPAGIKVTRCKDKDRFYVSVDGKPTGQTCPTERIQTTLGPHTVEIYDLQTEKHTEYKIDITDTRLSYRVKIDP